MKVHYTHAVHSPAAAVADKVNEDMNASDSHADVSAPYVLRPKLLVQRFFYFQNDPLIEGAEGKARMHARHSKGVRRD